MPLTAAPYLRPPTLCRVYNATDATLTVADQSGNGNTATWPRVTFDTVLENTANGFTNGTPATYITTPAGATHVEVEAHVDWASAMPQGRSHLFRNGAPTFEAYWHDVGNSVAIPFLSGTPWTIAQNPRGGLVPILGVAQVNSLIFVGTGTMTFSLNVNGVDTGAINFNATYATLIANIARALTAANLDNLLIGGGPCGNGTTVGGLGNIAGVRLSTNLPAYGGAIVITATVLSGSGVTINSVSTVGQASTCAVVTTGSIQEQWSLPVWQDSGGNVTIPLGPAVWLKYVAWTFYGGNSTPPIATAPTCYGTGKAIDGQGNIRIGVTYYFRQRSPGISGYLSSPANFTAISSSTGDLQDAAAILGSYNGVTFDQGGSYIVSSNASFSPAISISVGTSNFVIPGFVG